MYTGKKLETYFGIESTWKVGTGFGNSHIPFNPMDTVPVIKPLYTQKDFRSADKLVPTEVYDEKLNFSEKERTMVYKDPFLALTMFTYKNVTGFGGAGGGIDADMRATGAGGDILKHDTIWIQDHIEDEANLNDIDKRLKGGEITSYGLSVETGDLLMETVNIKTYDFEEKVETMDCGTEFHDESFSNRGGWSDWNVKNTNGVIFTAVKLRWGGFTAGDELEGIDVKVKKINVELPKTESYSSESLVASQHWEGDMVWTAEVTGILTTDALILEAEKPLADKTKQDIYFLIDVDANEEEYFKLENMYVESVEDDDIPKASEAKEVTVKFRMYKNSDISYKGLFEETDDPTSKINE